MTTPSPLGVNGLKLSQVYKNMKIRFRFLVLGLRPCQEFPRKKSRKEKGWMMDQHDVLKLSVAPKVTVRTLEKRGVGEIPTCRYRQICSDITPIYIYIILYYMFKCSKRRNF